MHAPNKRIIINHFTFNAIIEKKEKQQQRAMFIVIIILYRYIFRTQVPKTVSLFMQKGTKKEDRKCFAPKEQEIIMKTNSPEHNKNMYICVYRFYRHVPKGNLYVIFVCSSASPVHSFVCFQTNVYVSICICGPF